MAQVAAATFGMGSIPFYVIQAATAVVLLLAANTAFNGFPLLGSVLARDGYAPKALNTRGDRLVYSNGMIILGVVAMGVIVVYQANLTTLIQLYIIGVFVRSRSGRSAWCGTGGGCCARRREPRRNATRAAPPSGGPRSRASSSTRWARRLTVLVLVIVTITKFTHGAYLVFIAIPVLAILMIGVNRYYRDVEHEIQMDEHEHYGASGDIALILVNRLQKPVAKAIDYALAAKHDKTVALHVAVTKAEADALQAEWEEHRMPIPLLVIQSPYRSYAGPVADFIKEYREKNGSTVVTVYLPQYIVGHWWESLLHNRRASRIGQQLMLIHGVTIALVPWLLDSSELIYGRRSRPLPGQERAGRPFDPTVTDAPASRSRASSGRRDHPDPRHRRCEWGDGCRTRGIRHSGHPVPTPPQPA